MIEVIEEFLPNVLPNAVKVLPADLVRREFDDIRQVVALAIIKTAHMPFASNGQRYALFVKAARWELIREFVRPRHVKRGETHLPDGFDTEAMERDTVADAEFFDHATKLLPPRQRFAVRMQFREGLESREMAHLLGMRPKFYSKTIFAPAIRRMRWHVA